MRMTFSELAKVTRADFVPVRWPHELDSALPEVAAAFLVDVLQRLADHRPTELFQRRLGVVSPCPADFLLAWLFTCYGAKVHFLCPQQPTWNAAKHGPLFRAVVQHLESTHSHLHLQHLRDIDGKNFLQADEVVAEIWRPSFTNDPLAGRCDLVLSRGLPEVAAGRNTEGLAALAVLARVGGLIEVFGEARTPADDEALDSLVQDSGLLGLGIQSACHADSSTLRLWRLAVTRLSAPTYEYPRGEEDHASLQAHCLARLTFAARFVQGAEVLEAGCATGIGARLFRAEGARRVVGLDYSSDALERARAATSDQRIEFQQWDLNQTPLPCADASFDAVVCLEVLEHVQSQEALIAEFLRVLRPGGRLIVSVPNREFEEQWNRVNDSRNVYHVRVPGREELERLLASFGEVSWARQVDLAGSTVLEEQPGEGELAGSFRVPSRHLTLGASMVFLAVCTKGPVPAANPAPRAPASLQVYENYTALHLEWHRGLKEAGLQLARERWNRWADQNRMTAAAAPNQALVEGATLPWHLEQSLREWVQGNAALYCCSHVRPGEWPGDWVRKLAVLILQVSGTPPAEEPHQGPWELWVKGGQFTLRPVSTRPERAHAVFYPRPEATAGVRLLWQWSRTGARDVWFLEPEGWKQCDLFALLAHHLLTKTVRGVFRRTASWLGLERPKARTWIMRTVRSCLGRSGPPTITYSDLETPGAGVWPQWLDKHDGEPRRPKKQGRALKVIQNISSLSAGGAERQLCTLAIGLRRRGVDVNVLSTFEPEKECGHYAHLLRAGPVAYRRARSRPLSVRAASRLPWHLLRGVPAELQPHVVALAADLAKDRPDVLHCWLDQTNLIGAFAGLLTGVPAIVLGLRSLNPAQVSQLSSPYLQPWYSILTHSRRVHLVANSDAAAASYAEWVGLPRERIAVIRNGVELSHFPQSTPQTRREARRALGLDDTDRVVSGVLRLSEEKQPELFLEVVRRVHAHVPALRVLLVGTGTLEEQIAQIVHATGMADYVKLLGRRSDVGTILLASDANLLTSRLEGCPNIALEAQHLGVPIVATAAGGTPEAVENERTGLLAAVGDADGLARHLTRLLTDDALRARLAAAGPPFVAQRFGWERLVDETLALYSRALNPRADAADSSARAAA